MGLNSNSYNPQWRNHPGFSWSNTSLQLNPPVNLNTKPLGKLPSQPEFALKETCQAIILRSGKEVEKAASKNKMMIDDDEKVEIEANMGTNDMDVSRKNDVESVKKGKKDDANSPRDDEPKVDLNALPFP